MAMNNSIAEVHPELVSEWSEKNLTLTPDDITFGSNKKVWWRGACGHEWQASVKARSNGEKCPICSGARVIAGINDLQTTRPEIASEWSEKNLSLKPDEVNAKSRENVWWRCSKCGNEWKSVINARVKGTVSLLAKWLPSVNASNGETVGKVKRVARYLGMTDAVYRKTLVELRKKIRIIENNLREKDYSVDYSKQPSKAMFKYRKAFLRNDGERYNEFMEAVTTGNKQLHADTLAPYEIVRSALNANHWGFNTHLSAGEKASLNASWESLPNFCDERNALAVVDTSGTMYCYNNALPAAGAMSLGLYFGERNTGIFYNHFIEFSPWLQLIEIKGEKLC